MWFLRHCATVVAISLVILIAACSEGSPTRGNTRGNASDGELICKAVRGTELAASCSVDNSRKVIFVTVHTSSNEAGKICRGMLSEMNKVGVTGWRVTIRALLGHVLATCP